MASGKIQNYTYGYYNDLKISIEDYCLAYCEIIGKIIYWMRIPVLEHCPI